MQDQRTVVYIAFMWLAAYLQIFLGGGLFINILLSCGLAAFYYLMGGFAFYPRTTSQHRMTFDFFYLPFFFFLIIRFLASRL